MGMKTGEGGKQHCLLPPLEKVRGQLPICGSAVYAMLIAVFFKISSIAKNCNTFL